MFAHHIAMIEEAHIHVNEMGSDMGTVSAEGGFLAENG